MNYKRELLKWVSLAIIDIGNDVSDYHFDFIINDMELRLVSIDIDDEDNKIKFNTLYSDDSVGNTIRIEYDINFLVDNIVEFNDFYMRLTLMTDYYMEM